MCIRDRVNRVELKNIIPPREIQDAMEKQMKAERERREAILLSLIHIFAPKNILVIKPYINIDYNNYNIDNVDVVLHEMYHSATAVSYTHLI